VSVNAPVWVSEKDPYETERNSYMKLSILGSTGSIGTQSLSVAKANGFTVMALAAYSNAFLLEDQIRQWKPKIAVLYDEAAAKDLKIRVGDTNTKILAGMDGLCEAAGCDCDTVLNAIVGMIGITPTVAAIKAKKRIALANKESLVAGGEIIMPLAKEYGVQILPVDSEHSAIFQCLQGSNGNKIKKIVLTASGGPFFGYTKEQLRTVTKEQALNHPNWSMGAKITIDSATMMNKGLELIEAVHLFDIPPENIEIVIHRESIIHSIVVYEDNSCIAQMGVPDMKIPIAYALTYPHRAKEVAPALDLTKIGNLSFYEPDEESFPALSAAKRAIKKGGLAPAAANGANEKAVALFLNGKIKFTDIPDIINRAIDNQPFTEKYTLEDVLEADKNARLVASFQN